MLQADTATTAFQGYWPSSPSARARTCVRGFDEPLEAAAGSPAASTARTPSGSSCSYGETTSGRQRVTNLRLPGQYDERLLGSVGLQGPYYNWNRWYLPGVGRYLELDPLALRGKFNGAFGPDWYNYANGNPLRFADPFGLAVYLCRRVADLPLNPGFTHHWIVTGAGAAGMGACNEGVPGHGTAADSPYVTHTCINDHSAEPTIGPGVTCELIEDIDEDCVNQAILKCAELGRWSAWNQCQSYAADVIKRCKKQQNACSP